jgi:hypothetical protein
VVASAGNVDKLVTLAATVAQRFLAEQIIRVVSQSPYSPDLAPNDFWLFPSPKMGLKGTCFATVKDMAELWKIPKAAFRRRFQQWQDQWAEWVRNSPTLKMMK